MTEDSLGGAPPWLFLLEHHWAAWRENELAKGRDPDPYIEQKLGGVDLWPPKVPLEDLGPLLEFVNLSVPRGAESVWLAGSRSRGTHRPDSDWDVIAFHPHASSKREKFAHSNSHGTMPDGTMIELIIAHPDHWDDPGDENEYIRDVRRFGIRLR